jgi:hypothetical protein
MEGEPSDKERQEEKSVQLLADLVLWIANCPIKLEPSTVQAVLTAIQVQKIHERLRKL